MQEGALLGTLLLSLPDSEVNNTRLGSFVAPRWRLGQILAMQPSSHILGAVPRAPALPSQILNAIGSGCPP